VLKYERLSIAQSKQVEVVPRLEEIMPPIISESPIIIGILILIFLIGILSLVLAYMAWKWARRCFEQQERLRALFDDQMLLLGRFHEEQPRQGKELSGRKENVQKAEKPRPTPEPISPRKDLRTEARWIPKPLDSKSTTAPPLQKARTHSQQTEGWKKLIEERVRRIAQEFNIELREVRWYKKPSLVSEYPYILMISAGDKPKELGFSSKDIEEFRTDSQAVEKKLRALMNEMEEHFAKINPSAKEKPPAPQVRLKRE
jgi:hypothetical protein